MDMVFSASESTALDSNNIVINVAKLVLASLKGFSVLKISGDDGCQSGIAYRSQNWLSN